MTAILIVEDEAAVAVELAGKLGRLGYEVAGTAANGREAVAMACRLRPDLVLMDISLEGPLDGVEAARQICREYEVPVVYLTAHSDPATLARARISGPFGFILKPFEERELGTQIEMALYRHRIDEALRASETRARARAEELQAILDWAPVGLWIAHDPQCGSITGNKYANDRIMQAPPGANVSQNAPPGEAAVSFQVFHRGVELQPEELPVQRACATGKPVEAMEQELVFADGRRVRLLAGAVPLFDAQGRVRGAVGAGLDITDRKHFEESLRREQGLLDSVMRTTDVMLVLLDPGFNFLWVNPAYAETCGMEPEELVGKNHFALYPHEDNEAIFRKVRDTGEAVFYRDKPFVFPDQPGRGVTYWDWSLTPVKDGHGHLTSLVFSLRETTKFKRAEEAIRESQQRLALAASGTRIGMFEWDLATGEVRSTEQHALLLGLETTTTTTATTLSRCYHYRDWAERVHPDDLPRAQAEAQRAKAARAPYETEYRVVWPDGSVHWIAGRGVFECDAAGEPYRMLGIAMDVTARKRTEDALRNLNDTLEHQVAERTAELRQRAAQLRAMVAQLSHVEQRERRRLSQVLHDHLQQLLVAARMKVQRLQRRACEDEALAQIADEVDELIDQCISESRSLTVELSPPVLYDGGLAAGLDWLGRRVEEKHGLPVEVVADRAADTADTDVRVFLFQAVRELLFNVVKHAHATRARVSTAATEAGGVRIEVRDDGDGCDPRQIAGRLGHGTGFGLFHVRERLELLGGRLYLDTSPGKGTRLEIVVPPREPAGAASEGPGSAPPAQHGAPAPGVMSKSQGGLRVLLADDHPVVRKGLADLLREQPGVEVVVEARDGQEAVDLALEARPDVVVMDITMPRMDGIEATRQIKARLPGVRVIGLSMHEDRHMVKAMRRAGAGDYLRKDTDSEVLVAAILGTKCSE
jgi:PAS domain S-box-containing protein